MVEVFWFLQIKVHFLTFLLRFAVDHFNFVINHFRIHTEWPVHCFPSRKFYHFNKLSAVLVNSDFLSPQSNTMYIYSYVSLPGSLHIREGSNSLNLSSSSDTKPDSAAIFIPSNMGKAWTFVGMPTLKSLLWHIHSIHSIWLLWLLLAVSLQPCATWHGLSKSALQTSRLLAALRLG